MSTSRIGDDLEQRIYELFRTEIEEDHFFAKKESCKIYRKRRYYSKDRDSDIEFDVAIEIYMPGADQYSLLVLIECKNYSHAVPVDDVEEFYVKAQQVAASNSKAIVVSTAAFQSGAKAFARSNGIGLARYFDREPLKWELRRSTSANARTTPSEAVRSVGEALAIQNFVSVAFDLYLQSPLRETNALWDFTEDLVRDSNLQISEIQQISNPRRKIVHRVPFIEKDELESHASDILSGLNYLTGEVPLQAICDRERDRCNLIVRMGVTCLNSDYGRLPTLGRIVFDPLVIDIYAQAPRHFGRERFTLAHELAHHLLGHADYLVHESCDDSDFTLQRPGLVDGSDVTRLEFQANYFAASLLMPRAGFCLDFYLLLRAIDVSDKGFGVLFVDNQPCNLHNYDYVMRGLTERYVVSRQAASIRLESMGLLRDVRDFATVPDRALGPNRIR